MSRRVFSSQKEQRIEVFNEIVTVFTVILLSCFLTTDFVPDADVRKKLSFSLMGLTCLIFLITLLIILKEVCYSIKLKYTKCMNKLAHNEKIKQEIQKKEELEFCENLKKSKQYVADQKAAEHVQEES